MQCFYGVPNNSHLCYCACAIVQSLVRRCLFISLFRVRVRVHNSHFSHKSRTASYLAMQHIWHDTSMTTSDAAITYHFLQVLEFRCVYSYGVVATRTLPPRCVDERCWPAAFEPSLPRSSWRSEHRCPVHCSPSFSLTLLLFLFVYRLQYRVHSPTRTETQREIC